VRENPDAKRRVSDPLLVDVRGFNPEWQHAVQIQTNSWTVELRIPWNSVAVDPQLGKSLLMNIGGFRS